MSTMLSDKEIEALNERISKIGLSLMEAAKNVVEEFQKFPEFREWVAQAEAEDPKRMQRERCRADIRKKRKDLRRQKYKL
jgi:ribosomal protein L7/L12